jgi:cold shock CspA family protein/acyl-coenzyme A thioesterase PaaI-like protein
MVVRKQRTFGFIRAASLSRDVFFHASALEGGDEHAALAEGDKVLFQLAQTPQQQQEQQQQQTSLLQPHPAAAARGRLVAARVWRDAQSSVGACLEHLDFTPRHGVVARYERAGAHHGSGWLRYVNDAGRVSHLTFSAGDVKDCTATGSAVEPGQVVCFAVRTDLRHQQRGGGSRAGAVTAVTDSSGAVCCTAAATAAATAAPEAGAARSKHAYLRAVQLQPLSADERVRMSCVHCWHGSKSHLLTVPFVLVGAAMLRAFLSLPLLPPCTYTRAGAAGADRAAAACAVGDAGRRNGQRCRGQPDAGHGPVSDE